MPALLSPQGPLDTPPRLFDAGLRRARLQRARRATLPAVPRADFLRLRLYEGIIETLSAINRQFVLALELGGGDGGFREALFASEAADRVGHLLTADLCGGSAGLIAGDEYLPLAEHSLNLIISHLGLHVVNDVPGCLIQAAHALKPDGLYMASLFGGDTLSELRACLMEAELEVVGGAGMRIMPMARPEDLPDLLRRAGLAMPVIDSDRVKVSYAHPLALLADLRTMGETNCLIERPRRPLRRDVLARMCALYLERHGDDEGRVTATFELITMAGWKPHESQQKPLRPGSAKMRLSEALGVREGRL